MSAIGNYIHYSKKNYQDYGTTRNGLSNYAKATKIFNKQKEHMMKNIKTTNSANLKEIEKYLNSLLHNKGINTNFASEEAYKEFMKIVNEAFNSTFKGFTFSEGGWVNRPKGYEKINSKNITLSTLKKYKITLDKINQKISNKTKIDQGVKDELLSTLNEINKIISESEKNNKKGKSHVAGEDIINKINNALKKATLPYAGAIGAGFENFLGIASVLADSKAENLSDKEVREMAKELKKQGSSKVVGDATSQVTLDLSKMDQNLVNLNRVKHSLGKGWQQIDEHNEYLIGANETQDKVDVIFKWKDEELNVSAKNYNLTDKQDVHILTGSSLLYMIQHENADFINHWLNTIAYGEEDEFLEIDNFNLAHEAMKVTLLVKALTGQGLGRASSADTFILNARKSGGGSKVYVWSMKELLDNLTKNLNKNVKFSGYPNKLKMSWAGDSDYPDTSLAQTRITNLLLSLHNQKISVSIRPLSK